MEISTFINVFFRNWMEHLSTACIFRFWRAEKLYFVRVMGKIDNYRDSNRLRSTQSRVGQYTYSKVLVFYTRFAELNSIWYFPSGRRPFNLWIRTIARCAARHEINFTASFQPAWFVIFSNIISLLYEQFFNLFESILQTKIKHK